MYEQLHDEDDRAPPVTARATVNNTMDPSKHIAMNDDESIKHDLECDVDDDGCQILKRNNGATKRSADDLFGLDEDSSVLAKLIILNRQSYPTILTLIFYLGGDVINFLFAGRYIPSDNNNQILAGRYGWISAIHTCYYQLSHYFTCASTTDVSSLLLFVAICCKASV